MFLTAAWPCLHVHHTSVMIKATIVYIGMESGTQIAGYGPNGYDRKALAGQVAVGAKAVDGVAGRRRCSRSVRIWMGDGSQ